MEPTLEYANVTGRPSSRFVRTAAALSRGVASVQRQHPGYAAQWHAANLRALSAPGPRWTVLGDSMSLGIGSTAYDAGWVNQLQAELETAGLALPIVNLSASGARVPDVLNQQLPAWRALPPAPELVTVLIGSNDLMSRTHRDALPAAFAELIAQLPRGAVVATMPQPRAAARAVNALLTAAAERGDITLVDMRSSGPASWRGRLAADHFHPNELGYAGIAEAFSAPVRRALASIVQPLPLSGRQALHDRELSQKEVPS
ncbi:SGNH/GDSL hydrolase family protein [Jatrophihabitans sp.]|uniref:SGNH/GDSL hydrolase family protein n=1 Tax=Jatrophihabitans sp. TaxID=1932789 RepID=UPI0030C70628|nr:GDSL-like Lipase/Acylhydrolase [Jatrophihabitans sp.]